MTKTWLITGSSRGFGWELARASSRPARHQPGQSVAQAKTFRFGPSSSATVSTLKVTPGAPPP